MPKNKCLFFFFLVLDKNIGSNYNQDKHGIYLPDKSPFFLHLFGE